MISKTYNQLWWDREFIEKRIQEQKDYLRTLGNKVIQISSFDRYDLTYYPDGRSRAIAASTLRILDRFENQLEQIKKLK
jgi:hypothetical protein